MATNGSVEPPDGLIVKPETSPVPFQSDRTRRAIVASFWFFVFLGLPIWWRTTKLERRPLPKIEVARWASRGDCPVRFPVSVTVPVGTASHRQLKAKGVADAAQVSRELREIWLREDATAPADENLPFGVDLATLECVDFSFAEHDGILVHGDASAEATQIDEPVLQADALLKLIAPLARPFDGLQDPRAVPYAARYRLIFSLMNEDATRDSWLSSWDIGEALDRHIVGSLQSLKAIHNFTLETRIQRLAPLALDPLRVDQDDGAASVVDESVLKTFINEDGWNLASPVSTETILHFVLWVPSAPHRPFAIRNADGSLDFSGAFIRPQWGGVFIYNPSSSSRHLSADELDHPMEIFHSQLLALLGVPPLGPPLHDTLDLHDLQIQAVLRRRILETTTDAVHSLTSLLKLVKEQTNMRVAADVQKQVRLALRELDLASHAASVKPLPSLPRVLQHARLAQSWATEAFYSPSLLGLLYFPDEHKYAIYTPLFGPLAVPLIASAFRELKAWRKRRRERARGKEKVE